MGSLPAIIPEPRELSIIALQPLPSLLGNCSQPPAGLGAQSGAGVGLSMAGTGRGGVGSPFPPQGGFAARSLQEGFARSPAKLSLCQGLHPGHAWGLRTSCPSVTRRGLRRGRDPPVTGPSAVMVAASLDGVHLARKARPRVGPLSWHSRNCHLHNEIGKNDVNLEKKNQEGRD